jgi:hypothetical protein
MLITFLWLSARFNCPILFYKYKYRYSNGKVDFDIKKITYF